MADRWVLPRLLNAQAAIVDWGEERERRSYDGPVLETGVEAGRVQLRWLLHPVLGLPLAPFTVWRLLVPAGLLSDQELATLSDWEPVEIVGLPVDGSWAATGYPPNEQGPLDAPLAPFEAALRRLAVGAPRIGWDSLASGGLSLPAWAASDPHGYLRELSEGRLLAGLKRMLGERPDPLTHAAFFVEEVAADGDLRLHPRLLGTEAAEVGVPDRPARAEWRPLGLLAVSAGADALASLALGFGTALDGDPDDVLMVSVPHRLNLLGQEFAFELAAVVRLDRRPRPPDPPSGLTTASIVRGRPEATDGPFQETVGVDWDRPPNPRYSAQPAETPYPASYAIGAFGPGIRRAAILLTRRSEAVGGWLPFVPSGPDAARPEETPPIRFVDHVPLAATIGNPPQVIPDVIPGAWTYAVAAQDVFGRWSEWRAVGFEAARESPRPPALLGVRLDDDGGLEVDFAWDWSDRSPEFVELSGAFEDEPNTTLLAARLVFGGKPQPQTGGFDVIPLDPDRAPAADWGTAQDQPQREPGVRFYRLRAPVPLAFAGRRERVFAVRARGQCHLHALRFPGGGWNESPFGPPVRATIDDPAPPAPPAVPEAPQWASLPDPAGVSRAVLSWPGAAGVAGYVLYEATETAVRSTFDQPGPDTAAPFTDRLADLRRLDLSSRRARSTFRRVRDELIPPALPTTSVEVALPRGSAVIHLYAATAMSQNRVESAWPADPKQFIAVAAPRLLVPAAPIIEATADPAAAPPLIRLRLRLGRGPAPARIELYRSTREELAADADAMGPPVATVAANGAELAVDDPAPPGWRRLWYRAVAWTADDEQAGLVGARSPASAAVSVLLPPATAPAIVDLRGNRPGSTDTECLVGWESDAPAPPTPLGPHLAVIETADGAGNAVVRLDGRLDALPAVASPADLPPADPANRTIVRVGAPGDATTQFFAWAPRPAPDQPFRVTVKMIDPRGRIGRAEVEVPPLPPAPELGSVGISFFVNPPRLPPPGCLVVSWSIPVAITSAAAGYVLEVGVRTPGSGLGPQRRVLLGQVPEVANPTELTAAQMQALHGRIVRLAGEQTYAMFLRRRQTLTVVVSLTDSVARSVSEVGVYP